MASRYSDAGLVLVRSEADDQVWVPKALAKFEGELLPLDFTKVAGRLRAAKEAVVGVLMDPDGYEYRWNHVGETWVLQERTEAGG